MNTPRRHHQLAQGYLKRFANAKEQVRVIDRQGLAAPHTPHVRNVTVEHDFYTINTANGPSQSVEADLLHRIEGDALRVIESMVKGAFPPTSDDRDAVALYVALQLHRGPDKREFFQQVEAAIAKFEVMNIPRGVIRKGLREKTGQEPSDADVESTVGFLSDASNFEMVPGQNNAIKQMLRMLEGTTRVVMSRTWLLIRVKEALLTSDCPVVFHVRPENATFGVGLAVADEITLPLDRHHALMITREPLRAEGVYESVAGTAERLNRMTAAHAHRWVIHHPEDNPLEGIELPPLRSRTRIEFPMQRIVPEGK